MKVGQTPYRTIWIEGETVRIIDQRWLPHRFVIEELRSVDDLARAIRDMHVRGAGLIGATAGYGMYLAAREAMGSDDFRGEIARAGELLVGTRPTAVNLEWAVRRMTAVIRAARDPSEAVAAARAEAGALADEDAAFCRSIGGHGLKLIEPIFRGRSPARPVNVLTHCNAGWLAFVDHGSATAPIYAAHDAGIPVHVWVDETRPRNQGASLTAWELYGHGVPHTVIADNVGGHLMQRGMVDLVIVGSDRTTRTGWVANKVGTYLKALAAKDNGVPFYVALPSSTIDWGMRDGMAIPIEQRGAEEVRYAQGLCDGEIKRVLLTPEESPTANYAFDVTPPRLVTGLITERGVAAADEASILALFPERAEG